MDEVSMVAELLDEGGPSPEVTAKGRDGLAGLTVPVAVRRHARWTKPALAAGLVAASVAGLMTWNAAIGGGYGGEAAPTRSAPTRPAPPPEPLMSARTILLAAAENLDKTPSKGAYWYTRQIVGDQVRPIGADYVIERGTEIQNWIPVSPKEYHWIVMRETGAKPATSADQTAWRRAGSPDRWQVTASDALGVSGKPIPVDVITEKIKSVPVPAAAGEPFAMPASLRPGWTGFVPGAKLTPAVLRGLPTDQADLKSRILGWLSSAGIKDADQRNERLFNIGSNLLAADPAPPKVRAAAYQMLAGLPGMRSLGTVTDRLGRTGRAVAVRRDDGPDGPRREERLIIDPVTGRLLATEEIVLRPDDVHVASRSAPQRPGQVVRFSVMLDARWTDEAPVLPKKRYNVDKNGNPKKPECARC
ncbi:CU044_5270 family protein [Spirillospora sp. NPDC047279]|uniref:CU044_5270 family protein n=1 Tax=Spirillospora sp. NPDC047279 TaxID=3155478 RepID=UPI00341023D3